MVGVRPPERLESGALSAWLKSLNAAVVRGEGVRAPLQAPPALLAAALNQGTAGLREVVLARLAVAAVSAGISRLDIHLEHPTLIEALLEALDNQPEHITSLSLSFGPRAGIGGLLCKALKEMPCLTSLTLTPVATDIHLAALASAVPPLQSLDISYCTGVTDKGMRSLVGLSDDTHTIKDIIKGRSTLKTEENDTKKLNFTLHSANLWGTEVTTRGCMILLSFCTNLAALTCQWTDEAVFLMARSGQEKPLSLTQLLLVESELPPPISVSALCPDLSSFMARRPSNSVNVSEVLESMPSLAALAILQFLPESGILLPTVPTQVTESLTCLHLSLLEPREVNLLTLSETFPSLSHLELEGIIPTLPLPSPAAPVSKLENLRLITPITRNYVIEASVAVWAFVWARGASSIDLGSCKDLLDQHLSDAIAQGAFKEVEDVRLSGAVQITDMGINDMMTSCPSLRRLAFKMLPRERLAELETLKVKIRQENLDFELITYGWKI
ncbi:hypothetical protein SK128_006730 [Halocaridina rubra]|uniref:Uncharacterized protein n=1 Tax=Halocaridina rubra TaxID=373956 RepID=A0AAN8WT06_HALRR